MTDAVQIGVVTLAAVLALVALVWPRVARRRTRKVAKPCCDSCEPNAVRK